MMAARVFLAAVLALLPVAASVPLAAALAKLRMAELVFQMIAPVFLAAVLTSPVLLISSVALVLSLPVAALMFQAAALVSLPVVTPVLTVWSTVLALLPVIAPAA